MTFAKKEEINDAEAELYDRQIRLWGLEAQNRLRNSSVLLVGMCGLGAEIAKNLMLSGLKSLTILDDQKVTYDDFSSQFLLAPDSLYKNRAKASEQKTKVLNPMVKLNVLTESLETKPDNFFKDFDLVILVSQKYDLINRVDKICRKFKILFQAGGVYGWMGYAFFDFNNHLFLLPKPKKESPLEIDDSDDEEFSSKNSKFEIVLTIEDDENQKVQQKVDFASFENAFNIDCTKKRLFSHFEKIIPPSYFAIRALICSLNEKPLTIDNLSEAYKNELLNAQFNDESKILSNDDLAFLIGPQLGPVCAIVGSVISQEAIKALSQNDAPLKNVFIYSALDTTGIVCNLPQYQMERKQKHFDEEDVVEKKKMFLKTNAINYEILFKNRYTLNDNEYNKIVESGETEPIIVSPWHANQFNNNSKNQRWNKYNNNRRQYISKHKINRTKN